MSEKHIYYPTNFDIPELSYVNLLSKLLTINVDDDETMMEMGRKKKQHTESRCF